MIYIQPYYFWEGHYKLYTDSLFKKKKDFLICQSDKQFRRLKVIQQKPLVKNYKSNIFLFILSRITNYLFCIFILFKRKDILSKNKIHFLEFEPISIFLFLAINIFFRIKFIITIHSTNFYSKKNSLLFLIQRSIFYLNLIILNLFECKIIVHKKQDQVNINRFFKGKIYIIDYPSPKNKFIKKKYRGDKSLLIFGQVRDDKDMISSVKKAINDNFKITIAGKVVTKDEFWKNLKRKKKINIIDKFISNKTLENLIKKNDFILLPYGNNYGGSAGPLKDSLSFGQPVICSNIKQFALFLNKNDVGFLQNKKLKYKLDKIDKKKYNILQQNCKSYASKNNFNNFLIKHSKIYK